jgi:hypothetical protein
MPVTKHVSCGEGQRTPRVCAAFELVNSDAAFVELDDLRHFTPPDLERGLHLRPPGGVFGAEHAPHQTEHKVRQGSWVRALTHGGLQRRVCSHAGSRERRGSETCIACAPSISLLGTPSDHSTSWHDWIKSSEVRLTRSS